MLSIFVRVQAQSNRTVAAVHPVHPIEPAKKNEFEFDGAGSEIEHLLPRTSVQDFTDDVNNAPFNYTPRGLKLRRAAASLRGFSRNRRPRSHCLEPSRPTFSQSRVRI